MRLALYLVLLSLVAGGLGCTSQPIRDLKDTPVPAHPDGSPRTMAEVQKAILAACSQRGWAANVESEGVIAASLIVRAHMASVTIQYAPTSISILYRDSSNLHHHDDKIHRNYNRWVGVLYRTIMRDLEVRAQAY
jgi:hypothetical protein